MSFIKICPLSHVSSEKPTRFLVQGFDLLVVKSSDSRVWVFDTTCTHAEKSLEKGLWNSEKAEITCPFHKAVFAVSDNGAVKAPPAFVSLPVYQTQIQTVENILYVFAKLE